LDFDLQAFAIASTIDFDIDAMGGTVTVGT